MQGCFCIRLVLDLWAEKSWPHSTESLNITKGQMKKVFVLLDSCLFDLGRGSLDLRQGSHWFPGFAESLSLPMSLSWTQQSPQMLRDSPWLYIRMHTHIHTHNFPAEKLKEYNFSSRKFCEGSPVTTYLLFEFKRSFFSIWFKLSHTSLSFISISVWMKWTYI